MKSCQDYLAELRQNIHFAEETLRLEKKNLFRTHELFDEEKEKWNADIKDEEKKIRAKEEETREKEAEIEMLKMKNEEVRRTVEVIDEENEKINREIQKVKVRLQDKLNKFLVEQGNLENEMSKVQNLQSQVKQCNKWTQNSYLTELKNEEADAELKFNETVKELSNELFKKMEVFDDNLREIDQVGVTPRQGRLAALLENLESLNTECNALYKMNQELEKEISYLEKAS